MMKLFLWAYFWRSLEVKKSWWHSWIHNEIIGIDQEDVESAHREGWLVRLFLQPNTSNIKAKRKEIRICSSQNSCLINLLVPHFFSCQQLEVIGGKKSTIDVSRMCFSNVLREFVKTELVIHTNNLAVNLSKP